MDPNARQALIKRLKEEIAQLKEQVEKTERETAESDERAKRLDEAARMQAKSTLTSYLSNLGHVFKLPELPAKNETGQSTNTTPSVFGKMYPSTLRPWTEFPQLHHARFATLQQLLGDATIFPSLNYVESTSRNLYPRASKQDDPFVVRRKIHARIEDPAATILDAYLEVAPNPRCIYFEFGTAAYSLAPNPSDDGMSLPVKGKLPGEEHIPCYQWLSRLNETKARYAVLFGEYLAANKVRSWGFERVLGNRNAVESLFADCAQRIVRNHGNEPLATGDHAGTSPEIFTQELTVATVLCRTYHYMVKTGLLYAYIASEESVVFLAITPDAPGDLRYHFVDSRSDSQLLAISTSGRDSLPSQLTTLMLLAVEAEPQTRQWSRRAENAQPKWPSASRTATAESVASGLAASLPFPHFREDVPLKRKRDASLPPRATAIRDNDKDTEAPTQSLPYCTQACLLGLTNGGPLDPRCPNAPLHNTEGGSHHVLDPRSVRIILRAQIAKDLDHGCECLDIYGLFGSTGVLFKMTMAGYGYTFVAKGVQGVDEDALETEYQVYCDLARFQGHFIPVYLGAMDLVHPYWLISGAVVTKMMLMSLAGQSLWKCKPEGLDVDKEVHKTRTVLRRAGLYHQDIRDANLVWNEEVGGIMLIDFESASVTPRRGRLPKPEKTSD